MDRQKRKTNISPFPHFVSVNFAESLLYDCQFCIYFISDSDVSVPRDDKKVESYSMLAVNSV